MIRLKYSRLCCLVHDSLHRFTAKSTVSMTKEQEKSLLISLSQVLNKIKLWTGEFDSDSGSDSDNCDHGNPLIMIHTSSCHSSASECILKITNDLVILLAVESCYVQHLAGNVLVSILEFVLASGSYWEEFMQSLCFYFELIICKVISPSSDPLLRAKNIYFDSTNFKLELHSVLNNARWHSVGAIVLVLRTILKLLKHEDDVKILENYMHVLRSCIRNIPWDSCNRIFHINTQPVPWLEFCGYLVQLFCSLADSEVENPASHEIFNIFPKILTWCFGKQGEHHNHMLISQYIRHKVLVLMIRLSSVIELDCDTVVSWLHLIDKYFQDLLFESLTQPEADQDNCLKDSPFDGTCNRHLQRRVVFLYLRCAFSLISLRERCEKQCVCGDVKSCSEKGFTALYEWLQKHLPVNILVNPELYDDSGKTFAKSFLQLYMHEDDMLFEVLLQLTHTRFGYVQQIPDDWASQVVEKDILFILSDIFDPVQLFHLFLSELHYDHQVLLDYLISKVTGANCAEYLLRCLRIICDKWNLFLGFALNVEVGRHSIPKRRKFMNDSESATDEMLLPSKTNHKNEKTCKQPFHNARDCLLLLKKSMENLHRKDLFPYNPEVLLKRLARFEELCLRL